MNKYDIERVVGEGSFGKALLCKRKTDNKKCIIKQISIIKLSKKEIKQTEQESCLLSKLSHPNIVTFWESFTTSNSLYIVMEYADGGDLTKYIKNRKNKYINENELLVLFVQISLAIKHIHDRKILHRDLKSDVKIYYLTTLLIASYLTNIFLTSNGLCKLGDFGVSRVLRNTSELASTQIGTPYYMSPEIMEGKKYNSKTDIWSLGCVLYELTCLRLPFDGINMRQLSNNIQNRTPASPPDIYSKDLKDLTLRLLVKNPKVRPSINTVLSQPIIKLRISNILSDNHIENEFSHTVLHGVNILTNNNPSNIPPYNSIPISKPFNSDINIDKPNPKPIPNVVVKPINDTRKNVQPNNELDRMKLEIERYNKKLLEDNMIREDRVKQLLQQYKDKEKVVINKPVVVKPIKKEINTPVPPVSNNFKVKPVVSKPNNPIRPFSDGKRNHREIDSKVSPQNIISNRSPVGLIDKRVVNKPPVPITNVKHNDKQSDAAVDRPMSRLIDKSAIAMDKHSKEWFDQLNGQLNGLKRQVNQMQSNISTPKSVPNASSPLTPPTDSKVTNVKIVYESNESVNDQKNENKKIVDEKWLNSLENQMNDLKQQMSVLQIKKSPVTNNSRNTDGTVSNKKVDSVIDNQQAIEISVNNEINSNSKVSNDWYNDLNIQMNNLKQQIDLLKENKKSPSSNTPSPIYIPKSNYISSHIPKPANKPSNISPSNQSNIAIKGVAIRSNLSKYTNSSNTLKSNYTPSPKSSSPHYRANSNQQRTNRSIESFSINNDIQNESKEKLLERRKQRELNQINFKNFINSKKKLVNNVDSGVEDDSEDQVNDVDEEEHSDKDNDITTDSIDDNSIDMKSSMFNKLYEQTLKKSLHESIQTNQIKSNRQMEKRSMKEYINKYKSKSNIKSTDDEVVIEIYEPKHPYANSKANRPVSTDSNNNKYQPYRMDIDLFDDITNNDDNIEDEKIEWIEQYQPTNTSNDLEYSILLSQLQDILLLPSKRIVDSTEERIESFDEEDNDMFEEESYYFSSDSDDCLTIDDSNDDDNDNTDIDNNMLTDSMIFPSKDGNNIVNTDDNIHISENDKIFNSAIDNNISKMNDWMVESVNEDDSIDTTNNNFGKSQNQIDKNELDKINFSESLRYSLTSHQLPNSTNPQTNVVNDVDVNTIVENENTSATSPMVFDSLSETCIMNNNIIQPKHYNRDLESLSDIDDIDTNIEEEIAYYSNKSLHEIKIYLIEKLGIDIFNQAIRLLQSVNELILNDYDEEVFLMEIENILGINNLVYLDLLYKLLTS